MKIVIIGASAAGMSFAAKYKRNKPQDEIIIIEQRNYISFGACGLPYFAANFFSDTKRMTARTPEQAIKSGLDLQINTQVVAIDTNKQEIDIKHNNDLSKIAYDILIIATGAKPLIPNFGNYDPRDVYSLTTLEDGIALKNALAQSDKQRVTIVGGGFIGLEVLDGANHLNKQITLIDRNPHILFQQFSAEMVADVENAIRQENIILKKNCDLLAIKDLTDGSYELTTSDGVINADIIVLALGFIPNTQIFDLPKASNGALITDRFSKVADHNNIYAVGDCAQVYHLSLDQFVYMPLATTANKQARMIADKLAGIDTHLDGFLGSSCLKVLDYELARTGISAQQVAEFNLDVTSKAIIDHNQSDYYPGQEDIKVNLFYHPTSKVLLGGEIVGKKGAVGRLNALTVAITAKMTTKQLGYLDFCYAPPFARPWDALNVAGNVAAK